MPNLILSSCGTSLLTYDTNASTRSLINKYSNVKAKVDINEADSVLLQNRIDAVHQDLMKADLFLAKKMSAELNGIIKFYDDIISNTTQDHHILLCTDTWLGEEAAKIVEEWLITTGKLSVETYKQQDLQTAHLDLFKSSLSDLVKWCDESIKSYKDSRYNIIFNLTGGFKSIQGFLQTLALFYADESIYIFERSNELLRIPRLPIQMSVTDAVKENLNSFRCLSLGIPVEGKLLKNIPDTLLLVIEEDITLSAWGEIVWQNAKEEVYKECVYEPPTDKVTFSKNFIDSIKGLEAGRLVIINKKIDQLCKYLMDNKDLRSLDFKQLKGKAKSNSTHELDAWSDQDAKRIFCHFEDNVLILDELAKALH